MPVLTLRETDPDKQLSAFPEETSGLDDVLGLIGQVMGAMKKRKLEGMNNQFRQAAIKEMGSGRSDVTYDYDPATGQVKAKIAPQSQDAIATKIRRYVTGQQFGVDPVTGEPLPEEQLRKPRFGYSGNPFAAFLDSLTGEDPLAEDAAPVAAPQAPAVQQKGGGGFIPSAYAAGIDMPVGAGGAQPKFLSPLELEAQNAMAAGADPAKVKARLKALLNR